MTKPTLIYFAARGRAEVIRTVLVEAAVDWQEHHIGKGTPPANSRPTDFAALKASGLLPFEAAPVWEEADGFRLAQSQAIAVHLARTYGLHGKTLREEALVDQALGAYEDVRTELRKVVAAPREQRAALREELATKTLPRWMGYLDRLLRANAGGAGFLVGDELTVADLAIWVLLESIRDNTFGAAIDQYPALAAFEKRIGARPRIAEYVKSARRPAFQALPS